MPRTSRSLLLLTTLLMITGCQTEEIYSLASASCKDFKEIWDNGVKICDKEHISDCFTNHSIHDQLKPSDFSGAFEYGRCPDGYTCNIDEKKCEQESITCQTGETKCRDGKQSECQINQEGMYSWVSTDKQCTLECIEGYMRCANGNIYTCTIDGNWSDTPTTVCGGSGCSEGTIQPASAPLTCFECGNDELKCDGNDLVICSNHQLSKTACDQGCIQTDTAAYCRECKDNEFKCENDFIISCGKDGKWDDSHKIQCEHGCFAGARGDDHAVTCYECDEDSSRCVIHDAPEQNASIQKCLSNKWYDVEGCEFGCTDGADSKCHECLNDNTKYYNDSNGYCVEQKCKNNQYQSPEPYEFSCNKSLTGIGECLNGNAKCEDGLFKFCLDGSWNSFGNCDSENECSVLNENTCKEFNSIGQTCDNKKLKPCPNNASCKSDNSGCASCQNGTSQCHDNKMIECQNGEYKETACESGTHCEVKDGKAQCVKHDCDNGTQKCQNNEIQVCENYKWKTKNACGNNEMCNVNNGVARCSCTTGTSYCQNKNAIICTDNQWVSTECDGGKTCSLIAGQAKCIECESGSKCQDGTKIMTCQNNAWSAATSCNDNMTCTGNDGNAKCICTAGQAKCDSDNTKIINCKADGSYGSAESCGADQHCEGVAGSAICTADPMECSPGAKQCQGNNLQTCNAKGKWESETCELGCNNMACNECIDGTKECAPHYLKTCNSGKWSNKTCAYGCSNLACNTCASGTKRCQGQKLQTCNSNNVWEDEETCEFGCSNKACNLCTPDSHQCKDSNTLQVCKNNQWKDEQTCSYGCHDGVCNECTPNSYTCVYGIYLDTCSPDGKRSSTTCPLGCDKGYCYECTPGERDCDGNTERVCSASGLWITNECLCGCQNAACLSRGEARCTSSSSIVVCLETNLELITCPQNSCNDNSCPITCNGNLSCRQSMTLQGKYLQIPCEGGHLKFSYVNICNDSNCSMCD